MTDKIVVLSTAGSEEEGRRIGLALVEARLAACVNIIPSAKSIYRWKGAVQEDSECLLVIKTRQALLERVGAELSRRHSYEVPEMIALAVTGGSEAYLGWVDGELLEA